MAERKVSGSTGEILRAIREGRAQTRADLAALTGLGRSTVAQRVGSLIASGLVVEAGDGESTGGRPPTVLAFNAGAGVVLAADLGATHCRLEVTDLGGVALAVHQQELDIEDGPDKVLTRVREAFADLLVEAGRAVADVRGIGVGVPGPVEWAHGRPVSPPIMRGWDGVSIPAAFAGWSDAPVFVDNDVNIMVLAEHRSVWRDLSQLLLVKVGTGIGCGIIVAGEVYRGAQGSAGDIGHIRVSGHDDVVCRCGNVACLEAIAGGGAMAAALRRQGLDADNSRDVVDLARGGVPEAVQLVRQAGRLLGEVLASAVNLFNPAVIVIAGDVAQAHEPLLAGVREVVYRRSPPLATQHLRIVRGQLGERTGTIGAALTAIEGVLSDRAVATRGT
jgi:predicted NBD/HSP70 family sugar kinase